MSDSLTSLMNALMAGAMTTGLYIFCDIPLETALLVGFAASIAYSLADISRHLRERK